ncbi:MAG: beta-glucosidase, partial [Clostridia bacterium]|nr:beta-glucosidase [Clostridia bacterium]
MDLQKLIAQMTLSEKVGQLAQYNANVCADTDAEITGPRATYGLAAEDIAKIGSVLNFRDVEEMRTLQEQHLAADRNKIPLSFMMDVIHGYRTIYPIPLALGCSFDTDLVFACTRMAAIEASADGVHVTFAPMVDFVRDVRWGRVMETCGEDTILNSRMGAVQVRAYQGDDLKNFDNIGACVKHYAAYGGAEAGRDYNT